jgi:esterase/lipase superfamily enzyme
MPQFYMITNRDVTDEGLGSDEAELSYFTSDSDDVVNFGNWSSITADRFKKIIIGAANAFPLIIDPARQEEQKHVTIFIHGYNNTWADATNNYKKLHDALYADADGLGLVILFNWPSLGSPAAYLADREHAQGSAADLADVLSAFYDWLLVKQQDAATDDKKACRAKISIVAHSMGNYVLQEAMNTAWERKNKPLSVSLVNQLLMVAADVDNDLFKSGENVGAADGEGIANLTYRISALYSPRDPVLGVSAGLKHFGKRRLGRSGLDPTYPVPDNVWDMDCTDLFPSATPAADVHSVYFASPKVMEKMRSILQGLDRSLIGEE